MFYHNITFSVNSLYLTIQENVVNITLDEQVAAEILGVPTKVTSSIENESGSEKFLTIYGKLVT